MLPCLTQFCEENNGHRQRNVIAEAQCHFNRFQKWFGALFRLQSIASGRMSFTGQLGSFYFSNYWNF